MKFAIKAGFKLSAEDFIKSGYWVNNFKICFSFVFMSKSSFKEWFSKVSLLKRDWILAYVYWIKGPVFPLKSIESFGSNKILFLDQL